MKKNINKLNIQTKANTKWLSDISCILIFLILFSCSFLGTRNLYVPDEARYSEIPREMIASHNYLIPTINSIRYFEKPPLFYWMQVASIKNFGKSEWACRIPNLLMSMLGVFITYIAGRLLYSRKIGLLSSLILATSFLYALMSRMVTLDMSVSCFIEGALFCFILTTSPKTQNNTKFVYGFFIFSALAVMTKGLIGIFIPTAVIFLWLIIEKEWKILKNTHIMYGAFLFLAIVLPWHIIVQCKYPDFFNFYFIKQHLLRYTTHYANRYQEFWFFIPVLLFGFLPWIFYFYNSIKYALKNLDKTTMFLLIWISFIFIFFSISDSKLIPYILPIFPALSILIGKYLAIKYNKIFNKQFVLAISSSMLFIILFILYSPEFNQNSIKNLLDTNKQPYAHYTIVAYKHYYQDLPYYSNRIIKLVDILDELEYGIKYGDGKNIILSENDFWKNWLNKKNNILMYIKKENLNQLTKKQLGYLKQSRIINENNRTIIFTNDTHLVRK